MRQEQCLHEVTIIVGNRTLVLELLTRQGGYLEVRRKYAEYCGGTLASQRLSLVDWLAEQVRKYVSDSLNKGG